MRKLTLILSGLLISSMILSCAHPGPPPRPPHPKDGKHKPTPKPPRPPKPPRH